MLTYTGVVKPASLPCRSPQKPKSSHVQRSDWEELCQQPPSQHQRPGTTPIPSPCPELIKTSTQTPQAIHSLSVPALPSLWSTEVLSLQKSCHALLNLSVSNWNCFLSRDKNLDTVTGLRPPLASSWALRHQLSCESWVLTKEITFLIKETPVRSLGPFVNDWVYSKKTALGKAGSRLSSDPNLQVPWPWTSQPPELWEINFWFISYPVNGILLFQPKWTKIEFEMVKI